MVLCMLFRYGLPINFWGYAAEYAAYVLNRMPTRANVGRKSPLEILTGKPVTVMDVVVFGSPCKMYQTPTSKLTGKRSAAGIIIGNNEETKGYQVYMPRFQALITTRHVSQIKILTTEGNDQLTQVLRNEADDALERLALDRQRDQDGRSVSTLQKITKYRLQTTT